MTDEKRNPREHETKHRTGDPAEPAYFVDRDRLLRENPENPVNNYYGDLADHFDVTWHGPDLPPTATNSHLHSRKKQTERDEPAPRK